MKTVGRKEILDIAPPVDGNRYRVVENIQLIEKIHEQCERSGLQILNEIYRVGNNRKQFTGEFIITSPVLSDPDMKMNLIFQNSYDKTLTLKLASGFQVGVCENGGVWGDHGTFKRKHTGDIRNISNDTIGVQLDNLHSTFEKAIHFKDRMKNIEIDKTVYSMLVGRLMLEEELIRAEQLAVIKKEYKAPQFDYGVENTAWNLYSDITYAYKEASHPSSYIHNNQKLTEFFSNEWSI